MPSLGLLAVSLLILIVHVHLTHPSKITRGGCQDFAQGTEDEMPVTIFTLDPTTDEDFVAQFIETVYFAYSNVESVRVPLLPAPNATAVKIEAVLPAGGSVNLLEVRTHKPSLMSRRVEFSEARDAVRWRLYKFLRLVDWFFPGIVHAVQDVPSTA